MKQIHKLLSLFLVVLFVQSISAQDIHFSMPYMAPLSLNPALTGTSDADFRFGAIYRDQWRSVPVPFTTFSGFYDQKVALPFLKNVPLGAGLVFISDKAGDGQLSWNQVGLNLSTQRVLDDQNELGAGISLTTGQRAFSPELLTFGDQYDGEVFDPNDPTQEIFATTSKAFLSIGAGVNWQWQLWRSRTKVQSGINASHLNQPLIRFYDFEGASLPLKAGTYAFGTIETTEKFDVLVRLMYQRQRSYQEIFTGLGIQYHTQFSKEDLSLALALSYRWSDAFIIALEGEHLNWKWGLSYDINLSPFKVATNQRGGLELALHYQISKVKPPDEFKSCPIF